MLTGFPNADDYRAWSRRQRTIDAMMLDVRAVCQFDRAMTHGNPAFIKEAIKRDAEAMRIARLWAEARGDG